jgi:hypothetical protein
MYEVEPDPVPQWQSHPRAEVGFGSGFAFGLGFWLAAGVVSIFVWAGLLLILGGALGRAFPHF